MTENQNNVDKVNKKFTQKTRSPVARKCIQCGVDFISSRSDALYCGNACRSSSFRKKPPIGGPRERLPRFRLYEPFTFCG